jgi:ATP-dependent RNA helicase SUPV3L1/SUV3
MISADPVTLEGALATAEAQVDDPAASVGTVPAEPQSIEVWRLQRHNREQRGAPRHARGRDARRGPGERPAGDRPQGDKRPGEQRREGGRPGGHFGGRRSEGPENRPQRAGEAGAPEARGPRPDRGPRDGRPGPRRDERPNGERGRPDRQRGGERSQFDDRRPERRERQPDPNSPFAALAALKAQLEGRDNGKS